MASKSLNSKLQNLTISTLPNDSLNIVVSKPKNYELTERLKAIIRHHLPNINQRAGPAETPESISSLCPRQMFSDIITLFDNNLGHSLTETNLLIQVAKSYISNPSTMLIQTSRSFWKQLARVIDELTQRERQINAKSALLRAIAMPISNDCQTVAVDELLSLTKARSATPIQDRNFIQNHPNYVESQLDLDSSLTDVLTYNPQTLGITGRVPPTNYVRNVEVEALENFSIPDLGPGSILRNAHDGMLALYSHKFLNTPLKHIVELGPNPKRVSIIAPITLDLKPPSQPVSPSTKEKEKDKTRISQDDLDSSNMTFEEVEPPRQVYCLHQVDLSALDWNKSILQQDWSVVTYDDISPMLAQHKISHYRSTSGIIFNVADLLKIPKTEYSSFSAVTFNGVMSYSTYSFPDVMFLGNALRWLWDKVKSIKLPSLETLQMGANILSKGLGVAGNIIGSSGLVGASGIMESISKGLGALIPEKTAAYPAKSNPIDFARASILRHAESIIPNLVVLGYEQCGQSTMSAQSLRQTLSAHTRDIVNGYAASTSTTELLSSYTQLSNKRA